MCTATGTDRGSVVKARAEVKEMTEANFEAIVLVRRVERICACVTDHHKRLLNIHCIKSI